MSQCKIIYKMGLTCSNSVKHPTPSNKSIFNYLRTPSKLMFENALFWGKQAFVLTQTKPL